MKSTLTIHWKDWCWSWGSNTLATWWEEWTHWKRPWCWEDWGQEEKRATADEMVGWHHRLNEPEFKHTPEDDERQGSLECCSPRGHRVGHDLATEQQQQTHAHMQEEAIQRTEQKRQIMFPHKRNSRHYRCQHSLYTVATAVLPHMPIQTEGFSSLKLSFQETRTASKLNPYFWGKHQ